MSSIGYCFRGVKRALNRVGVTLTGTAAYMARTQLAADNRFQMVSINQLRRGDILVHDRSAAHPYGHIAVYLGNGQEASDHVQHLVLGGRYGKTVAFRPKDGGNHLSLASSISRGRSPQAVALAFDRK
jgi:cell wall-associated NlpC family hydrolase